jgi:hypothetical protein
MDDQLKLDSVELSQDSASMWENEARKAWAYLEQIAALCPAGGPNYGVLERVMLLAIERNEARIDLLQLQLAFAKT